MPKKNLFPLCLYIVLITGCFTKKLSTSPTAEVKAAKVPVLTSPVLNDILHQHRELFDSLLQHNDVWQIKIIYTEIDRRAKNHPVLKNYYFNIDPKQYFYPASTVKMPTAILSLQRLHELNIPGLDRNTTMITEAAYSRQDKVYNDPNSVDGRPTIANYIRKIFLVSDNDAFNRLYEFLGQEYINNTLHQMGFDSTQIIHRLNIFRTEDENRHTNPVRFYAAPAASLRRPKDTASKLIYEQPLVSSRLPYQSRTTFLGKGYYNGEKIIDQPFDFSKKNRFALADLHSILETVIFPKAFRAKQRFHLSKEDYQFLYRYMSMKPGESDFPQYDSSYNGAYSKFLMYGGKGDMEPHIRIFNKEGDAYGFLTDVAYIVDFKNNVEFFLSASIYCNSDNIFNDDHYDYENVGLPFLKNLGQVIYQYELQRKRKRTPDLSTFKIDYSK
jgi:beta-lactamase class A